MYSQVAGTAAIIAPPGTFGRLSNLIAGGRSILNTLERGEARGFCPKMSGDRFMVLRLTNGCSSMRFGPCRLISCPAHSSAPDESGLFGRGRWIRLQSQIRKLLMALPQKTVDVRKIVPLN